MSDIPTEALHDITIHQNTSSLDNDMLTQRLSLIPILQGKNISFQTEVSNNTEDNINIFSHDLSDDLMPDILLVMLKPGQGLSMVCTSQRGVGFSNAKWSPVTDLTYKQARALDGSLTPEEMKKIRSIIPHFKMRQLTDFIDTNLIFMINQICEREVFSIRMMEHFTIGFSTIDGSDARDRLVQALEQLIQRTLHLPRKGHKLETNDYSLGNLLMLEHPDKDFTCIKQHNLDDYFQLSSVKGLPEVQDRIVQNFRQALSLVK